MNDVTPSPYDSPDTASSSPVFGKLSLWEIIVVIAIVAILVALILPAVQSPSGGSSRTTCKNNLKMIGLALHNYHDRYGSFPPAVIHNADGRPAHSWRVLILPFLEEENLYRQYDFDEPWNGPNNILLQDKRPSVYGCFEFIRDTDYKSAERTRLSRLTNYVAVTGPHCVFAETRAPQLSAINDEHAQTIMVAETCQNAVHWMKPDDLPVHKLQPELRQTDAPEFRNHKLGLHGLLVDGSVKFIPYDLSDDDFQRLVHTDNGHPAEF